MRKKREKTENMELIGATNNVELSSSLKKKKLIVLLTLVIVVVITLVAGIVIYNSPANRLSRQLELGYKYLENEQYEEAVLAFERAIDIDDRCVEAYAGALQAYTGTGDQEKLETFYDETITVLAELDEECVSQNMDYVVEIYVAADAVYVTDAPKAVQILEEGFEKTEENDDIREHLITDYLEMAKDETEADSYEEALVLYDRLLELDQEREETIEDLCNCLNEYIDSLMESRQYDRIRELAEKYRNVATGVNFDAILAKIEELEKWEPENRAFMQMVYDLMAAEDYEGMHGVDGSDEASSFIERMDGDRYIYIPNDDGFMSGIGAGVYIFGGGGYYFYYGTFENGVRRGTGTEFINNVVGGYVVFEGQWDKDAPNGAGVITTENSLSQNGNGRFREVCSGNLVDGLWNGDVKAILTDLINGGDYDLSFSAKKGIPTTDKTEEWMSVIGNREEWLDEGTYIYAYDFNGNTGYGWWDSIGRGETTGVDGFTNN